MTRQPTLSPAETSDELRGSGFRHENECLTASFSTPDFSTGARLVAEVADIANELNHHPDVTLGWGSVGFSLTSHDEGGVTHRDLTLARRIAAAAAALGIEQAPDAETTDGEDD
ncbi:4a-hydroxytetrahydrobiopterin dehydratase [Mycetocola sp. 2940]|uniref:4a-hydroxytetrahydrobiopterin dehydratase n=1 Tax=Mycetocola sp. 2940 TaxID=3156452 RepID=UPI0033974BC3